MAAVYICAINSCHTCIITIKACRIWNKRFCLPTADTHLQSKVYSACCELQPCARVHFTVHSQQFLTQKTALVIFSSAWEFKGNEKDWFIKLSITGTHTSVLFYNWRNVDRTAKSGAVQYVYRYFKFILSGGSFTLRFGVLGFGSTGDKRRLVLWFVEWCFCNDPPLEGV